MWDFECYDKRDSIKEKQLSRWIMKYVFHTHFLSMQLKKLSLFLIQGSQPILINWMNYQPIWWNPYKGKCFSIVESLMFGYINMAKLSKIFLSSNKNSNSFSFRLCVCKSKMNQSSGSFIVFFNYESVLYNRQEKYSFYLLQWILICMHISFIMT